MFVYQQFNVDVVAPAYDFLKKQTPAEVLPCKFYKFF